MTNTQGAVWFAVHMKRRHAVYSGICDRAQPQIQCMTLQAVMCYLFSRQLQQTLLELLQNVTHY